ncbi:cupin domain-containing protein [Sinosporangium siamense]|uniref:Gentisate 1,2-dioxygenase n=1 Tax=Sinosporangium siamense TaxID=1367973 RepID=A0A919RBR6_9ACTN|nr:cupin domain-containing protein [Sinosporangium siamense]GII90743.1 gentisate 1,2-dioxygenase [Sinosporangium siamense]
MTQSIEATSAPGGAAEGGEEQYYRGLGSLNVEPLWRNTDPRLLPTEPRSQAVPYVWRYADVRRELMTAGRLISAEEAERRVLMLINPGLAPEVETANNLYAGIQLVLPGEIAPMHKHAAAAFRFVIEGTGAYTAVNGERAHMHPGDIVLTPSWAWHDHGNFTDEPVVWMDGLDLPLINKLESNFFVDGPEQAQEQLRSADSTERLYAASRLNPAWKTWDKPYSPLINYPWSVTEQLLKSALDEWVGSPTDGVIFEFTNPESGGPIMPTMGAYIQALPAKMHTEAHQHTSSAIYHVVRGRGQTIVDGEVLDWSQHDTFTVPGWSVHEHINTENEPAVLFSHTDIPVLKALGFYQERACVRQA